MHPQWLADNADATIHWTGNFPKQSSQDEMEMVQDEVVIEEPAPIDFDWCEESSNCGDIVLDQDIPASLEEEVVTNSGTEAEDDVSFDISTPLHILSSSSSSFSIQLPRIRTASVSSNNPRSLLKKNLTAVTIARPPSKFRQTLLVNRSLLKANVVKSERTIDSLSNYSLQGPTSIRNSLPNVSKVKSTELPPPKPFYRPAEPQRMVEKFPKPHSKTKVPTTIRSVPELPPIVTNNKRSIKDAPKFRQSINVPKSDLFQSKRMRQLSKHLQQRNQGTRKDRTKLLPPDDEDADDQPRHSGGKGKGGKGKRGGKKFVNLHGENITINHDVESGSTLDPRKPIVPPLMAESHKTILRAASLSDEDDVEVDIESDGSSSPPQITSKSTNTNAKASFKTDNNIDLTPNSLSSKTPSFPNPSTISDELRMALQSTGVPDSEIDIDLNRISPLEKYFHYEFFEGRPTKTPDRFLKIRNFIIHAWHDSKPIYVSKTAVRHGLKQCGDVNCISRIHSLLEQIGAINFGCEQLVYIRPLSELSELFAQPNRSKLGTGPIGGGLLLERRSRIKVAGGGGGPVVVPEVDANYTVSHDDGTILLPRVSRLEDSSSDDDDEEEDTGRRKKPIKTEFQLIDCMRFNQRGRPAPFRVSITLSTLMCLQLHSLSARNEVMGFLGGHRERRTAASLPTLRLTRYKPCATSSQSSTMCEMCPGEHFIETFTLLISFICFVQFVSVPGGTIHQPY